MDQQSAVLQLISDAYHVSEDQIQMLSNFSNAALQYAVRELSKKKEGVKSPVNWIASVARSFDAKGNAPKTGRGKGFNNPFVQKIVQGSFNPNHSPTTAPKMSTEERKAFLLSEIPKLENLIAQAESGRTMYGGVDCGRKMLANVHQELKEMESTYAARDPQYEEYLQEISKDKSDPARYKELVRNYDSRRSIRRFNTDMV